MDFIIPDKLNLKNSIEFFGKLESIQTQTKYIFDWGNMNFLEPLGMLYTASKMRKLSDNCPYSTIVDKNLDSNSYAANMGFFNSFDQSYGKEPGELEGNLNYIPIKYIKIKDLEKKSINKHIVDTIEKDAQKIAKILTHSDNKDIINIISYSIREIMRNVVEHSSANYIWYSGQYWKNKNMVEIAILDEGIGIAKSLKENNKIKYETNLDAISLALNPGVSSKPYVKNDKEGYSNSGFGLYMLSNLCRSGGDFIIGSGNALKYLKNEIIQNKNLNFGGTFIRMRLNLSELPNLLVLKKKLIREGDIIANKTRRSSQISVSKLLNITAR